MKTIALAALGRMSGVTLRSGIDVRASEPLLAHGLPVLPSEHFQVLQASNGVEVFDGYIRLFGLDTHECTDALVWNRIECWKFAWGERAAAFWCFGETVWGDQYAYETDALAPGRECPVYFLDAWSMTPRMIAASFGDFLDRELLRVAARPYDEHIVAARSRFGPIANSLHLAYVPPILLGGAEDMENVVSMPGRSAMIASGDIATQVDAAEDGLTPAGTTVYEDELGRTRIRVLWS